MDEKKLEEGKKVESQESLETWTSLQGEDTEKKVHQNVELAVQYSDLSHESKGVLPLGESCAFFQNFNWEEQELKQKHLAEHQKEQGPSYLFWSRKGSFLQLLQEEGTFTLYTGKLLKWWHIFIPKKQYGESMDQLDESQVVEVLARFYEGEKDVFGDV